MKVVEEPIQGLKIIEFKKKHDERGYLLDLFNYEEFSEIESSGRNLRILESESKAMVRRGMHFQWNPPMAKLMRVSRGSARLVSMDLRIDSPSFGKIHEVNLNEEDYLWIYAEYGFARGFQALESGAKMQYILTSKYNFNGEGGISSLDSKFLNCWPKGNFTLSKRDQDLPNLDEWLTNSSSRLLKVQKAENKIRKILNVSMNIKTRKK